MIAERARTRQDCRRRVDGTRTMVVVRVGTVWAFWVVLGASGCARRPAVADGVVRSSIVRPPLACACTCRATFAAWTWTRTITRRNQSRHE